MNDGLKQFKEKLKTQNYNNIFETKHWHSCKLIPENFKQSRDSSNNPENMYDFFDKANEICNIFVALFTSMGEVGNSWFMKYTTSFLIFYIM